jgi:hypothetical protein
MLDSLLAKFWTVRFTFDIDKNSFLEIAKLSGDRGNYLLHLVADGVDDRMFPRYFFDLNNGIEEAEAWLRNWFEISKSYPRPYPHPTTVEPIWSCGGKDCIVELRRLGGERSAIGRCIGFARVLEGHEELFVVDAPDLFPRVYFDEAIAIEELTAWLIRRGQI